MGMMASTLDQVLPVRTFWLQFLSLSAILLVTWALLAPYLHGATRFKRVGQSLIRQVLPGGRLMISHADEYVEEGYEKVTRCYRSRRK